MTVDLRITEKWHTALVILSLIILFSAAVFGTLIALSKEPSYYIAAIILAVTCLFEIWWLTYD